MVADEERMLTMMGWDHSRIERLRVAVEHVLAGNPPISRRFIEHRPREHGFEPHNRLRSMVERALYPAYRDACLEAEEQLEAARLRSATSPFRTAAPGRTTAANATTAAAINADGQPEPAVPADVNSSASQCQGQALSDFIDQAIRDLAADEKWDAKSGRRARST